MRLSSLLRFAALAALPLAALALPAPAAPVRDAVPVAAELFELNDVRLLDSPFQTAMQTDKDYLLSLEPDRLLAWFRRESGLPPKAQVYPGWESAGVAGHSLGHYLSALAMMWQATGDEAIRARAAYIVDELAACQAANGNGYVGAIPGGKKVFAEVNAGDIRIDTSFNLNGLWVPWYTMHKVFAGLLDVQRDCANPKAGDVVTKLADWCVKLVEPLSEEKMQQMLSAEQGGMAESLAEVYARTGDPRFLTAAKKFRHNAIFEPMALGRDTLNGRHGNTQIPKFIGYDRIYELTGAPEYGAAARNFWRFVALDRSFAIGGHGVNESFFPMEKTAEYLRAANGPETCNSYNMLKLTEHLFREKPTSELADFYERALYNHILSSELPHTPGALAYYTSMREGAYRGYSKPFSDFWCCVGTGMENHAKYGRFIYAKAGDGLLVNLFIPSELKWGDVKVSQQTKFPAEPRTKLVFSLPQPRRFAVSVRDPYWVPPGTLHLSVNGQITETKASAKAPGYIEIDREWKDGDVLTCEMPMTLRAEALPHSTEYAAMMYGPIVLAGQLGRDGLSDGDFRVQSMNERKLPPVAKLPVLLASLDALPSHFEPAPGGAPLTFRSRDLAKPAEVTLAPFYATHQQRYAVYWKVSSPEQYAASLRGAEEHEKKQQALLARTIDHVAPGEQQPEVDHGFQGERSRSGVAEDRGWRDADNGWFSYRLKITPDRPASILCKYWGGEGFPRTFDVLVDGQLITTQKLHNDHPGEFFDVEYVLPAELTRGKREVTVKFQSHGGGLAGGIFDLRTVGGQ